MFLKRRRLGLAARQTILAGHTWDHVAGRILQLIEPFERGFGNHNQVWQYMNAGVTPIVAGELARGAFAHGFERYGVDILRRLTELGRQHGNRFYAVYTGAHPVIPPAVFTPLDIRDHANIDTHGDGVEGVPGWTGEGDNDLHELPSGELLVEGVPFQLLDPAAMRVLVVDNYDSFTFNLVHYLIELGAEVVEVSCPHFQYGLAAYYLILPSEVSSNLARFDGVRFGLRVEAPDTNAMYSATRAAGFGDDFFDAASAELDRSACLDFSRGAAIVPSGVKVPMCIS